MWYKKIKEHRVFLLIFGSAAILRLFPLFNYQFTLDELSGLDRTQFNSFKELIEKDTKPQPRNKIGFRRSDEQD